MKKLQREFDLEQLNYLLKPIIFIYMENDQLYEFFIIDDRDTFGNDITSEFRSKLNDIISENSNLVSLEIQEKYLSANHFEKGLSFAQHYYKQGQREMLKARNKTKLQSIEDFSFDDDREFINLVKKIAKEIEERYK